MHDVAYAFDKVVADDPDDPGSIAPSVEVAQVARGRVPTAELTMQVLTEGFWHRRTPDLTETACGLPLRMVTTPPRREELTLRHGKLCELCFTEHERAKAYRLDREAEEAAAAEDQRWLDGAPLRAEQRAKRKTGDR